jgi:hypothetical protein
MGGALPRLPLYVFMARTGTTFTFLYVTELISRDANSVLFKHSEQFFPKHVFLNSSIQNDPGTTQDKSRGFTMLYLSDNGRVVIQAVSRRPITGDRGWFMWRRWWTMCCWDMFACQYHSTSSTFSLIQL